MQPPRIQQEPPVYRGRFLFLCLVVSALVGLVLLVLAYLPT